MDWLPVVYPAGVSLGLWLVFLILYPIQGSKENPDPIVSSIIAFLVPILSIVALIVAVITAPVIVALKIGLVVVAIIVGVIGFALTALFAATLMRGADFI